jgi:hypothetical protein
MEPYPESHTVIHLREFYGKMPWCEFYKKKKIWKNVGVQTGLDKYLEQKESLSTEQMKIHV